MDQSLNADTISLRTTNQPINLLPGTQSALLATNLYLSTMNAPISLEHGKVDVFNSIHLQTTNGRVTGTDVKAGKNLRVESTNGSYLSAFWIVALVGLSDRVVSLAPVIGSWQADVVVIKTTTGRVNTLDGMISATEKIVIETTNGALRIAMDSLHFDLVVERALILTFRFDRRTVCR